MHDVSHHLVERVLPDVGIRQYVLSPPSEVVGLLAARGEVLSALSCIFVNEVFAGIRDRVGSGKLSCGAVVCVQRFTKTISCYPHLHVLALDGGYVEDAEGNLDFEADRCPTAPDLRALEDRVMARFSRWLRKHGYIGSEELPAEDCDAWW